MSLSGNITMAFPQLNEIDSDVKMVIWDLDDTFWEGTLAEGSINFIEKNRSLVKLLAERGIISSIVSKNNYNTAKEILERYAVWEFFIFPSISFEPKGKRVSNIIQNASL